MVPLGPLLFKIGLTVWWVLSQIIDVLITGNLKSDFLSIRMDEKCLHCFLQLLVAVHHFVYAIEAQTFLVFIKFRLHWVLSSRNMHMAEFFLNWMIELNLIFIPYYFIFKLSEIEISNLESPFLYFWCYSVNKYIFLILSWLI